VNEIYQRFYDLDYSVNMSIIHTFIKHRKHKDKYIVINRSNGNVGAFMQGVTIKEGLLINDLLNQLEKDKR